VTAISRARRHVLIAAAVLLIAIGTCAGFGAAYLHGHPWLIDDEWTCSRGELPVVAEHGTGAMCLREGATIPAGFKVDPLGNRPLDCDGRSGWIVVQPDAGRRAERSCYRADQPVPPGWHRTSD
jgi:hypothetical protein